MLTETSSTSAKRLQPRDMLLCFFESYRMAFLQDLPSIHQLMPTVPETTRANRVLPRALLFDRLMLTLCIMINALKTCTSSAWIGWTLMPCLSTYQYSIFACFPAHIRSLLSADSVHREASNISNRAEDIPEALRALVVPGVHNCSADMFALRCRFFDGSRFPNVFAQLRFYFTLSFKFQNSARIVRHV